MPEERWFVYLLECATGRIYTGITPDLAARMTAHKRGRGALFTRINPPKRLLGAKPLSNRREAQILEAQVKRLPADYKRQLAATWSEQYAIYKCAEEASPLA